MKRTQIPLDILAQRLGHAYSRRVYGSGSSGHVCWLLWTCNGPENMYDTCRAIARSDKQLPSDASEDVTSFDHYGFPKEGWELTTCSRHGETFLDFPSIDEA